MPHNQISNNQEIMLDSENPSNLLHYETHIRLMYRYAIVSFAGNVKLHNFMEARTNNNFDTLLKPFNNETIFKTWFNQLEEKKEKETIFDKFKNLSKSKQALFIALLRPKDEIGDKIPVDGFGYSLIDIALSFVKNYEVIDHINEKDRESKKLIGGV